MDKNRLNIVAMSVAGVYPPATGASQRIYNLYLNLSNHYNIFLVSQNIRKFEVKFPIKSQVIPINEYYSEYKCINNISVAIQYMSFKLKMDHTIYASELFKIQDSKFLKNKINSADVVQIEHPWQFNYLYNSKNDDTPIIYSGHNVEFDHVASSDINFLLRNKILNDVKNKENFALKNSNIVFMVSEEDKSRCCELYDVSKSKIIIIPNGTSIPDITNISNERNNLKKEMGYKDKKIIFFIAAKHKITREAVESIIKIANHIEDNNILFLIVGKVCEYFNGKNYKNVQFKGFVNNVRDYFKVADIALNPMLSGSGTNIKMLEYMAYECPIIVTPFGARGTVVEHKKHAIICDIDEFPYWIEELSNNEDLRIKLGNNARKLAEEKYDWKIIAEKVNKIYRKIIN